MNFVKRKSSNAGKMLPAEFKLQKEGFLNDICAEVIMNDIPEDLIFNWDQTGIHLVPVSEWTMEKQGTKNIIVTGVDDKRQITLVMAATMTGCFLHPQILYEGKTTRCHPSVKFPEGWDVSHMANHWSNETSMIQYLQKLVIPFLKSKRKKLGLPASQPALAIFDVFKGQQTDYFKEVLQTNNIRFVVVPANCTDKLQPMDLAINKPLKDAMKRKFQTWYAKEMQQQLITNTSLNNVKIDFRMSIIKPKSASWLMSSVEEIRSRPLLAINGFRHAGITNAVQSLKSTKPL